MKTYTVKQGDCLLSIAAQYGIPWKQIYDHPKNSLFRKKRPNPETIKAGDILYIPEKNIKWVSCQTSNRNKFVKKGMIIKLRLKLMFENKPRSNESYRLIVNDTEYKGITDQNGFLEERIPSESKKGKLFVGINQDVYILNIGSLDPIEEISGKQARLKNFGYYSGSVDGIDGPKTKAALEQFEKEKKYSLNDS